MINGQEFPALSICMRMEQPFEPARPSCCTISIDSPGRIEPASIFTNISIAGARITAAVLFPLLPREAVPISALGAVTRSTATRTGVVLPIMSSTKSSGWWNSINRACSGSPTTYSQIHHGWLADYAAGMGARGLRLPFECITRADRVTPKVADLLAELGCFRVWIGSESGSQRVLDTMQRGVTTNQVRTAVQLFKERGIETGMFLMWGYDGEQLEDVEATIGHVKDCRPDIFFTTISYPIKGTPYFDRVSSSLVRINGWSESTDRDIKIAGRPSRTFYRHADALLRVEMASQPDTVAISVARSLLHAARWEVES